MRRKTSLIPRNAWFRAAVALSVLSLPAVAYTYDLPGGDFQAGTPIRASDVNDKFAALLDATNELDAAVADLEADGGASKTLTWWADRAIRWNEGENSSNATSCWASINGRPGCIVSGMTHQTHVLVPIDNVPDGAITDWGMHIGTSNGTGSATTWSCDLRFNGETMSSLQFVDNSPGQWNRYVDASGLAIDVDNYAAGPALGAAFGSGWNVHCASNGVNGRLDLHQVFVRYQEG